MVPHNQVGSEVCGQPPIFHKKNSVETGINNNPVMSNKEDKKKAPLPTFSGMSMPTNITVNIEDDIGEETTRRVGGFTPSFEPVSFQPSTMPSFHTAPSINTMPQKASVQGASSQPTTKRHAWTLRDAPVLPEFHPLERTAVFVPRSSPNAVASRISEVLRERSIQASYDSVKAKVRCITGDNVDFRIRLYRGRNQYNHGIIVEVQRRYGTSVDFHNITRAILGAAEGNAPQPPPQTKGLPLVSEDEDDYEPVDSTSSLSFIAKLLSHPGYDAHYLAMQTLSSLTDPVKMGRKTAQRVADTLLNSENDVAPRVFDLVVERRSEENLGLQLMAMTVLANALQSSKSEFPMVMREALRPVLLNCLRDAESNPQMAYLAAKCIERLIKGDHDTSELYAALEKAQAVGEARHAALGKQSRKCMDRIDLQ